MVGNILGLALGAAVSTLLAQLPTPRQLMPTLALFAVYAAGHLSSTYLGVRTVALTTLNGPRLYILFERFFETGEVLGVELVNRQEPIVPQFVIPGFGDRLVVGAALEQFPSEAMPHHRYSDRFFIVGSRKEVSLLLSEDAGSLDILKGVLVARRMLRCLDLNSFQLPVNDVLEKCYKWADNAFPTFLDGLKREGWSVTNLLIHVEPFRYCVGEGGRLTSAFALR